MEWQKQDSGTASTDTHTGKKVAATAVSRADGIRVMIAGAAYQAVDQEKKALCLIDCVPVPYVLVPGEPLGRRDTQSTSRGERKGREFAR